MLRSHQTFQTGLDQVLLRIVKTIFFLCRLKGSRVVSSLFFSRLATSGKRFAISGFPLVSYSHTIERICTNIFGQLNVSAQIFFTQLHVFAQFLCMSAICQVAKLKIARRVAGLAL